MQKDAPAAALKGKQGKSGKQKAKIKEQEQEAARGGGQKMDKAKRKQLTAEYQERERRWASFKSKIMPTENLYWRLD